MRQTQRIYYIQCGQVWLHLTFLCLCLSMSFTLGYDNVRVVSDNVPQRLRCYYVQ